MKDRFKFRVWDKENFNYLEFEGFKKGEIEFNFDIDTNSIWIEFNHNKYILEQCTDLKDKNGTLIYMGDVVKDDATNSIYKVGEKKCAIYLENDEYIGYFHELSMAFAEKRLEVIGNIYENPELLEVEND